MNRYMTVALLISFLLLLLHLFILKDQTVVFGFLSFTIYFFAFCVFLYEVCMDSRKSTGDKIFQLVMGLMFPYLWLAKHYLTAQNKR